MPRLVQGLAFACCYGVGVHGTAQELGSLFTTPEERAYLDYQRQEYVRRNQLATFDLQDDLIPLIPEEQEIEESAPEIIEYRFGGVMTRLNGNRVVWLNGTQVAEADLPDNISLVNGASGTLINIRLDGTSYQLKPGQTFNSGSGQVQESTLSSPAQTPQQEPPPARPRSGQSAEPASAAAVVAAAEQTSAVATGTSDTNTTDAEAALDTNVADVQQLLQQFERLRGTGNANR